MKNSFKVAILLDDKSSKNLLTSIFTLTENRQPSYIREDNIQEYGYLGVDICVVDPNSLSSLKLFLKILKYHNTVRGVFLLGAGMPASVVKDKLNALKYQDKYGNLIEIFKDEIDEIPLVMHPFSWLKIVNTLDAISKKINIDAINIAAESKSTSSGGQFDEQAFARHTTIDGKTVEPPANLSSVSSSSRSTYVNQDEYSDNKQSHENFISSLGGQVPSRSSRSSHTPFKPFKDAKKDSKDNNRDRDNKDRDNREGRAQSQAVSVRADNRDLKTPTVPLINNLNQSIDRIQNELNHELNSDKARDNIKDNIRENIRDDSSAPYSAHIDTGRFNPINPQKLAPPNTQLNRAPKSPSQTELDIRALVIDETMSSRQYVAAKLHADAEQVDYAVDGQEALIMMNRRSYDVVFLDVDSLSYDGYGICKRIKSESVKLGLGCMVVIMTQSNGMIDKIKASMSGCDVVLKKPLSDVSISEIVNKVKRIRRG